MLWLTTPFAIAAAAAAGLTLERWALAQQPDFRCPTDQHAGH